MDLRTAPLVVVLQEGAYVLVAMLGMPGMRRWGIWADLWSAKPTVIKAQRNVPYSILNL
jgi:hypothetical protein